MANRVPLIVDIDDNNKIKELPVADNLDLSGSDISQVANITATGVIRQGGLPVSTFTGDYDDLNGKPPIPISTSDLVNDGDGDPGLTFITSADVPPFSDTLNDVILRGQTSSRGIIISAASQDVGLSVGTQNNNVANFTFNNTDDQSNTPVLLTLNHSDQEIGALANIQFNGRDNAGNSATYGKFEMSVSNNTVTGLTSSYQYTLRHDGSLTSPLIIDGNGISVAGTITGDISSGTTSTFNAITAATETVTNQLSVGDIEVIASTATIQSGTTQLNLGANNTNITIGGDGANNVDIESGKVNISNVLEVDGELKAQTFPLSATFTGGVNVTGNMPNFRVVSEDTFATYGSTVSAKLKSDRKNPPTNNDHATIDFLGLSAQDNWSSYRTVGRIRLGTEDDDSVLGASQSSFFYKFEVFDNTHAPTNVGDYTSVPFVIGYNSEPSGASGDVYKATIVNFYNSQDDFIVLGGSTDGNGFPNKLLKVDYSTEVVSTHGAATIGGDLTVNGTGTSTVGGNLTVTGNLQVDGTTTTINSTELVVDDKLITLASGSANAAAADGAGIEIDFGVDANASLKYVNSTDRWTFDREVATTSNMYATTFNGALAGNATTATTLANSRDINGVAFNGSADITITASTTNALTIGDGLALSAGTTFNGSAARTITNDDKGSSQDIIKTITVADTDGAFTFAETGSYVASGNTDTLTFVGGTSIDIDIDATNGAVKVNNTGVTDVTTGTGLSTNTSATGAVSITNTDRGSAQNIFKTVAVSGSNSIVAETNSDTLTVTGGNGISLAGNASTDTLTITNSGVLSVVAGNYISVANNAGDWTITNTGLNQVAGTANEIEVTTKSGGSQTIGLPASIQTTNATFTGTLAVNGNTTLGNTTADQVTFNNATGTPSDQVNPAGYMQVTINGVTSYIPYYQ